MAWMSSARPLINNKGNVLIETKDDGVLILGHVLLKLGDFVAVIAPKHRQNDGTGIGSSVKGPAAPCVGAMRVLITVSL